VKNFEASIKAKLLNLAKTEKKDFVLISRLYMQEGVLRRIGLSDYAGSFSLKGGLLLYSLSGFTSRPTQDIDLLGSNIPTEEVKLKAIFEEILSIQFEDGLLFKTETMTFQKITEGTDYHGQRLKVECSLGTIRTNLKIDIGFGDVIYPDLLQMNYPTLLDANHFIISTYSLESVIAEKFEAMIVLDTRNSRMKDFYDIYEILTKNKINISNLKEAVKLTLERRKTAKPKFPAIFQDSFVSNSRNLQMWSAFLSRIKADDIEFQLVMQTIRQQLEPIYQYLLR
jgi:hypothetical protein